MDDYSSASKNDLAPPILVSIIIPSYNHAKFVRESIVSALSQTYSPCEVIVVDDASTDGSAELLKAMAHELPIRLIQNPENIGLNATIERALEAACGSYVSLLASDDILVPEKVEKQMEIVTRRSLDGVYGSCRLLHEDGRTETLDYGDLVAEFEDGSVLGRFYVDDTRGPLLQSALIKTEVIKSLWKERLRYKSDDWVTIIKLLEQYDIALINEPMFYYRQHARNSHLNYWNTLPMRVDVISNITPEDRRMEALANILYSHANYLNRDGKRSFALRMIVASFAMDPTPSRTGRTFVRIMRMLVGWLRLGQRGGQPE